MIRTQLIPKQVAAIKKAREIAGQYSYLGEDIAKRYRQGHQQNEIASEYMDIFPTVSLRIARTAVAFIIRELIPARERKRLAKRHRKTAFSELGRKYYEEGKACFSLTEEERYRINIRIGKALYEQRKGIFAMSQEERQRVAKKVGRRAYEEGFGLFAMSQEEKKEVAKKASVAAGCVLWSEEELNYLLELSQQPEYTHSRPQYFGRPNLAKIAEELNRGYHDSQEVRTTGSVNAKLSKRRRGLESKLTKNN